MRSKASFDIVIPWHGDREKLVALLQSVSSADRDGLEEIIVIANPPRSKAEKSIDGIFGLPITLIETNRVGVSSARNLGLERCTADICIMLDDDCRILNREFLQHHRSLHQQFPQVSGIGGLYTHLSRDINVQGDFYLRQQLAWIYDQIDIDGYAISLIGGNMSYKKSKIIGQKFDEDIFFGGAENSLNYKLINSGHKLLVNLDLKIAHDVRMDTRTLVKKAYFQAIGSKILDRRYSPKKPQVLHFESIVAQRSIFQDAELMHMQKIYHNTYRFALLLESLFGPRSFRLYNFYVCTLGIQLFGVIDYWNRVIRRRFFLSLVEHYGSYKIKSPKDR